ncbi:PLD-like domain-containing protein [Thermomonospora echinospora]|uniref:PLD-like domain-containing protein n=1 Tax=Thermomonospora echinospora TaxID=1992 RepID=A0A1H5T5Z4_9ACTN|nr:DISARM system phospholipase D-like protein DrmC [Thermomonospora echinospora]SEF58220.1 PLD-like domain-containing protein [Thermomonospora echinospora]
MSDTLPSTIAAIAEELPSTHLAAWCRVLRTAPGPTPSVEAELLEARPGYAMAGTARRLVDAWRRAGATGDAIALALEAAAVVGRDRAAHASTIAVSGPTSDAVPVRLTSQVALEVIRDAGDRLLVVSFAAHGVAAIITELTLAADRGVHVDLVLETSVAAGGTLAGPDAARVFRSLADHDRVRFWYWPQERRPVTGRSRAALHAKLIAADEHTALLGSANLTDRALDGNLEIGVVLREPAAVRSIVRHFRALMRPGTGPLAPFP